MEKKDTVVIFIFTDGKKILVEKRFLESLNQNHYLIPGGTVKDFEKDLKDALQREMMEELGVKPLSFKPIPTDGEIFGIHGQVLVPYLINKWAGRLPAAILDKGNPLIWLEIGEVLNSPFEPTRKIAQALKKYLKTK